MLLLQQVAELRIRRAELLSSSTLTFLLVMATLRSPVRRAQSATTSKSSYGVGCLALFSETLYRLFAPIASFILSTLAHKALQYISSNTFSDDDDGMHSNETVRKGWLPLYRGAHIGVMAWSDVASIDMAQSIS